MELLLFSNLPFGAPLLGGAQALTRALRDVCHLAEASCTYPHRKDTAVYIFIVSIRIFVITLHALQRNSNNHPTDICAHLFGAGGEAFFLKASQRPAKACSGLVGYRTSGLMKLPLNPGTTWVQGLVLAQIPGFRMPKISKQGSG